MQQPNSTHRPGAGPGEKWELGPADLAKLFDYPAIGELFSETDTRRLDAFRARLAATRDELERIVRYGAAAEAQSATRAARGIEVTLEFLDRLQQMRLSAGK
jgi:hypothetical protein